MGRLSGKIALITGIAGGQGRAAALAFAREGAKVVGCDIKAAEAEETAPPATPLLAPRDGLPPVTDTSTALVEYAEALRAGTGPVAVDAERASGYRYGQRAYLVQLRRTGAGTRLQRERGMAAAFVERQEQTWGPSWLSRRTLQQLAEVWGRHGRVADVLALFTFVRHSYDAEAAKCVTLSAVNTLLLHCMGREDAAGCDWAEEWLGEGEGRREGCG